MFQSRDYLEFVGTKPCAITGIYGVHLHHEAVSRKFRGRNKNKFDFGVIPLIPRLHIEQRHGWGRKRFWSHYGRDPVDIVVQLISEYIHQEGADSEAAEKALELILSA